MRSATGFFFTGALFVTALLSVAGAGSAAQTTNMRTLIEQAMDQQVDIEIKEQPLSAAFEMIGNKTGVKLQIRPQAVDLLPYGQETRVKAVIKNVSLRQGLTEMLSHLGMTLAVRDDHVALEPVPALRRICRRATWGELRQLHQLRTTPWTDELAAKLPFQFQIRIQGDVKQNLLDEAKKVGTGMAADVLENACNHLNWTWYPWDNFIVVLSQRDQAERFIDRPVSLRYTNQPLADVLMDLSQQADLRLRMEPGVIRDLPIQMQQNMSLQMRDTTIRQGLEMISGATGLAYEVTPEEIIIRHTKESRTLASRPVTLTRQDDPVVGQIQVPGKSGMFTFTFFVRESDLSARVSKLRKEKIKQAVQTMEKELEP